MGLKQIVKSAIINKYNAQYQAQLESRKCSYHAWITGQEAGYYNVSADEQAQDGFWLAYNAKGHLSAKAMEWIADCFLRNPEAVLVYGDEDVWDKGHERISPCFKPDWSPDLFEQKFYLGSVVAVRKEWVARQDAEFIKRWELVDCGMSPKEDCQAIVEESVYLAGGFKKGKGRRRIVHIPRVLFHNESKESADDWMEYAWETQSVQKTADLGLLSVIIPSKDNPKLLDQCIGSIVETAGSIKYEIVVVDNGSSFGNRKQIEAVLHHYRQSDTSSLKRILYHYEEMSFNFSRMCNIGAKKASGDLLLFLNDDVTLAQPGTLEQMAALAVRPVTGAVGLKLLYPMKEGQSVGRIQHVGITNLPMGPVHKLQFCQDVEGYYWNRNRGRHNLLAVTAACLMVEKNKFAQVDGFYEDLAVAFNDVDLCLALYEAGYENVCECDWYAYHNESFSRGDDESSEKLARLLAERERLYAAHPSLEGWDPYYPKSLNRDGLDTLIRPIYEHGKNTLQHVNPEKGFEQLDEVRYAERMKGCREDACLMVRVESVLKKDSSMSVTGWSVVLGDNNACYDKALILCDGKTYYWLELMGQYRPDLIENMPDQTNVGLCGFRLEWEAEGLPSGSYRVGMYAHNRMNGTSLINWSNRMVEV